MILTPDELRELTGKTRSDAQAKELEYLCIPFKRRRDGSIVVLRSSLDQRTIDNPEPALHF